MEFEKRKAATLASLRSEETDKSPKVPAPVESPSSPNPRAKESKKKPQAAPALHHSRPGRSRLRPRPHLPPPIQPHLRDDQNDLVFRFEPLIIAVECKDVASAQSLVSKAIACGFRESGITNSNKRVIIAIRCSIRLEVPLGSNREIMVSREYLRVTWRIWCVPTVENGCENAHSGSRAVPGCSSLSVVQIEVSGEPEENLYLWGHSACTLENKTQTGILVFGGFGGMGRHGRRNHSLLVDPLAGSLRAIQVESSPSPRLGHTSSLVGDCVFVIGGRADPEKILSDVWVLNAEKNEWKLLECSGDVFPPRHRHAAAV
ncbi:hypothetical protein M0R45_002533 [Rubus argutus]|uniref:tRNA(Phe) 7-[(3-amino-3-carboxypropyl)-4-demethylwyosine(37)-N(4)]-methyltransferase n=1 Tax=Rubus argutus TaxID=59490 RepID=A0AAW1VRU9_RUBAR